MTGTQPAIGTFDRRVNLAARSRVAVLERRRAELMEEFGRTTASQGARLMADLISVEKLIANLVMGTRGRAKN